MLRLHKDKVIMTVVSTVCVFLGMRPEDDDNLPTKFLFADMYYTVAR